MSENNELNKLLKNAVKITRTTRWKEPSVDCGTAECNKDKEDIRSVSQWSSSDNKVFVPASITYKQLPPAVYEIASSMSIGLYFHKVDVFTSNLIRFPQTNLEKVVDEIQKFWERESLFREYNLPYRRGVLLWGPAGSGKSTALKFITNDVIERNGIVIKFTEPNLFMAGLRVFREIQPETPIVVLMEDIDAIIDNYNESSVLNILDGIDKLDRIVFLSTTNYPERLGARIVNRPSRFDKRFKIGHPNEESRKLYFENLIGKERIPELKIDLDRWIKDTDGFSIAHLKELFVAVVIQGDSYNEAITTLQSMKEVIDSKEDNYDGSFGFKMAPEMDYCN